MISASTSPIWKYFCTQISYHRVEIWYDKIELDTQRLLMRLCRSICYEILLLKYQKPSKCNKWYSNMNRRECQRSWLNLWNCIQIILEYHLISTFQFIKAIIYWFQFSILRFCDFTYIRWFFRSQMIKWIRGKRLFTNSSINKMTKMLKWNQS